MKKSTSTKRALTLSVVSLLVCAAVFIGSTFAWFTDSASVNVSSIRSGKLDVQLLDENGNNIEGKTLEWKKADGHETEAVLWEPGCTYELPAVKVKNNGNLALKYKIAVNGVKGDSKLLEVIEFTYGGLDISTEGYLAAGEETDLLTVSAHMKETANNDYQNLSIEGIELVVVATQDTVEFDSETNEYDKNATYPAAVDGSSLSALVSAGGNVVLGSDIEYSADTNPDIDTTRSRTMVTKKTTLDLAGNKILFDSVDGNNNWAAFYLQGGRADLTVNGNGTIEATSSTGSYCFHLSGGPLSKPKLTINGGTYIGEPTAVNVEYGTAYINGGFFDCKPAGNVSDDVYRYTLNCIDKRYKEGSANIIVTGGTFVNFNPADNQAEGPGTNFVADGYTVISENHGDDVWYTVAKKVDTIDDFKAISQTETGNAISLQAPMNIATTTDGDFTVDKDVAVDFNNQTVTSDNGNIAIRVNAGNVTLKNGTITALDGVYCTVSAADAVADVKNMTLNNSTAWGNSIKAFSGGVINVYDTEVNSTYGGGAEAAGGTINIYDSKFTQAGAYDWNSTNVAASNGGVANIYSGEFGSANYGLYIFNSGATINVYGGSFDANTVLKADKSVTSHDSVINVYGGDFTGKISIASGAVLNIESGTFSESGLTLEQFKAFVADGSTVTENNGVFTVTK
jgi:predicted ribosomally synthesized peptide with SipW-like signal peptide